MFFDIDSGRVLCKTYLTSQTSMSIPQVALPTEDTIRPFRNLALERLE